MLPVGYPGAASPFLATRHAQPVLAAFAYAACAAAGIWSYAVRIYQDLPEPRLLFTDYLQKTKAQTLAATRVQAFEDIVPSTPGRHAGGGEASRLVIGVRLMVFAPTSPYW